MGIVSLRGRKKNVLVAVVVLYVLVSLQWSNLRIAQHFHRGFKTLLPTTGHVDKGLNLKKYRAVGALEGERAAQRLQDGVKAGRNGVEDLREQLSRQFPYDASQPMPRRVWQTWRDPLSSPKMPPDFRHYVGLWTEAVDEAPSYEYALVADENIPPLLESLYGSVPQVLQAFEALPRTIIKADFFRYLILYARGGIYSDMDTEPLKPLHTWPSVNGTSWIDVSTPVAYKNYDSATAPQLQDPGFVVGIEADPDRPDWHEYYARRIQFCQWTIQSKPGHPVLRELIINITATTLASVESYDKRGRPAFLVDEAHADDYNVNMRDKKRADPTVSHAEKKNANNIDGSDIMNWAGPGVFSDAVFGYMNNLVQTNNDVLILNNNLRGGPESTQKYYRKITEGLESGNFFQWEFFTRMTTPAIVDDIMVLPITSFSPDVGHMGAGTSSDELALVHHNFGGTWKDKTA
ncbi:LAFE_0H12508g1_1 [Lachancea fermentati]|uniref:LAFE_0H12508g1_1 n=1 Tax=Lachancea fermentati TaxID=4955 RepID=A0A1G4MKP1_LACFM|nr:LAFE_0H12508g1_1 [Lachancea fermentati]